MNQEGYFYVISNHGAQNGAWGGLIVVIMRTRCVNKLHRVSVERG